MVYGMILLGHIKWKPTEQRVGIQNFAKKIGLKVDKFFSYAENADFSDIRNNDTVIFYDWSCICSSRKDINKVVEQLVKNHIYVYSAQSKYRIDKRCNFDQLNAAFLLFEDIRFRFLSVQNTKVVQKRVRSVVIGEAQIKNMCGTALNKTFYQCTKLVTQCMPSGKS